MKKGQLFLIMWISGAWKWTLIENLKKQEKLNLSFMKSYVTRPIREWEINWNIYNFISLDEFKIWIEKWEFLEYELNHWLYYYWTKSIDVVENWINKWKKVLKEIDIKWLKNIFNNNPDLKKYITTIFLDISKELLIKRIKFRQPDISDRELNNRIESLDFEKKDSQIYCDYIIDTGNKNKEETLEIVLEIIKNK